MNVGKLGDAKTLERLGQACQSDTSVSDFHIEPSVEKPVGRG